MFSRLSTWSQGFFLALLSTAYWEPKLTGCLHSHLVRILTIPCWLRSWTSHKESVCHLYGNTPNSYSEDCFVQSLRHVRLFVTPWTAACQSSLPFTISQSLLKFMSTESVILSNRLTLCCLLLLLPSIFPSISGFSSELAFRIKWPKYWSFSISPSNEYSGLIQDWLVWSPCSPRDSQESSPTPQFKSTNCLVLSLFIV